MVAFRLESATILRRPAGDAAVSAAAAATGTGGVAWATVASAGPDPVTTPEGASLTLPLTDDAVLALQGPGLSAEDRDILPPSPPSWRPPWRATASRGGGGGRLPGPGQPAPVRAARRREPRPAHSAGLHQGGILEPPVRPARVRARRDGHPAPHHRRRGRPVECAGGEPPRHEPPGDRGHGGPGPPDGPRRPGRRCAGQPRAARRGVVVSIEAAVPLIETDPVLVERVVANLVDNALLHGAGKAVRVEAGRVADWVDLRVIDHGPGIRPADRDLVFLPFQRLGDSDNRTGSVSAWPSRAVSSRPWRPAGPRGHPRWWVHPGGAPARPGRPDADHHRRRPRVRRGGPRPAR